MIFTIETPDRKALLDVEIWENSSLFRDGKTRSYVEIKSFIPIGEYSRYIIALASPGGPGARKAIGYFTKAQQLTDWLWNRFEGNDPSHIDTATKELKEILQKMADDLGLELRAD